MTAFEKFFKAIREIIGLNSDKIWPDFEPSYQDDYIVMDVRGINTLIINCGKCDGPSDPRSDECKKCISKYARNLDLKNNMVDAVMLTRIYYLKPPESEAEGEEVDEGRGDEEVL
ncbi:MAG: hypothetical protein ACTSVF_03910 [Candidatus Asgardarchaeia archaeon]